MSHHAKNDHHSYTQDILRAQIQALEQLTQKIGESFFEAAQRIISMPSGARLIFSGLGKAGFIGMKLSASFASIGVPSFFIHPSEAVHGDLGRIAPLDIVFLISNSGETYEVVRMVPLVKQQNCSIIALTSRPESHLGQKSDLVISLPTVPEAGPHALAPTTSTLLMLAAGDALFSLVAREKKTSKEKFAQYHPGGLIGRSLMPVVDLMRTGDSHCVVKSNIKCREVLHRITSTKGRPGAASIIDDSGILVGIFTDGDLRRLLEKDLNFLDAPVNTVMSKNPKSVSTTSLAEEALQIMTQYQIDQVVVIDESKKPVGLLDIQDVVRPS